MGIELVKFIVGTCGQRKLSGNAYKVLVAMACTALDQPNAKGQPARLYFAGWEPLAVALGFRVTGNSMADKKAKEAVRRATKELREAGLIEPLVRHARTGHSQRFRLNLRFGSESNRPPDLGALAPPNLGDQEGPRLGGNRPPDSGAPRKEEEGGEDSPQDSTSHPPTSTPDRPRADRRPCDACGTRKRTVDGDCVACCTRHMEEAS